MITKLFRNAVVFTPTDPNSPLAGQAQADVRHYERGALLCRDGLIESVGEENGVLGGLKADVDTEIDCHGQCVIPGFVDPHTHMCFARRREGEFILRMEGTDYLEILRQGGGILSSVNAVRAAEEEDLLRVTRVHALSALRFGTTTLEMKSGYGLTTEAELKMLRVIDRVSRQIPQDVVATFLGAHAIPAEYVRNPDAYVDLVIQEMIPAVVRQDIAQFCDVFCERGVFSLEQSRNILEAAKVAGLKPRVHADEVHDLGGAGLAAEVGAVSADHLLAAGVAGLTAMAERGVIGVLLPATAYSLRKAYAPARNMIELGVPIALATDCNPGSSYTESMPFVFGLSVLNMHLSVFEALVASTLNAAYAIGLAKHVGSLDVGKSADFLILDGESPAILAYHAGVSPVSKVFKRGELVWKN